MSGVAALAVVEVALLDACPPAGALRVIEAGLDLVAAGVGDADPALLLDRDPLAHRAARFALVRGLVAGGRSVAVGGGHIGAGLTRARDLGVDRGASIGRRGARRDHRIGGGSLARNPAPRLISAGGCTSSGVERIRGSASAGRGALTVVGRVARVHAGRCRLGVAGARGVAVGAVAHTSKTIVRLFGVFSAGRDSRKDSCEQEGDGSHQIHGWSSLDGLHRSGCQREDKPHTLSLFSLW